MQPILGIHNPKKSMTSYARNKVSNSQIKAYPILAKTHIVHGFAWTQKPKNYKKNTQNKLKIGKKMNFEAHKVASFFLWTNFSSKIQQQQTQLQSQMMATWSPNLNAMFNHVGHSTKMPNAKLQNSS
jgi:hypothetical protein